MGSRSIVAILHLELELSELVSILVEVGRHRFERSLEDRVDVGYRFEERSQERGMTGEVADQLM